MCVYARVCECVGCVCVVCKLVCVVCLEVRVCVYMSTSSVSARVIVSLVI